MEQLVMQALLVTLDPILIESFTGAFSELGIVARTTAANTSISEDVRRSKFEAVLIDFDTTPNPVPILTSIRQSPSTRNAVIFAVATQADKVRRTLANSVHHVFNRLLDSKEIRRVLHGAYDRMARERRRYFRCAAELPVLLTQTRSGLDFKCTTMNVSSGGMALRTPSPLSPGENVQLVLFLQGTEVIVRGMGTVVWDDKHGKTGVSFNCASSQYQSELDSWLDAHFDLLDTALSG